MYSDRNSMLQNANNPVPVLGVIPGKAFPDYDKIEEFVANSEDASIAVNCYPGGSQDINHDIMPLDTLICLKNSRTRGINDAEPNECGVVSVAGLCWDDCCSQREMEDMWYWGGIVQTEMRRTMPMDGTTPDPESGFATIRAGTCSVINNGDKTFYPGDLIAWRFPPAPFNPKADGTGKFNNGSVLNSTARYGTPATQFRPEYVPFDHTDFTVQMAAAFAAINEPYGNRGISDKSFMDAFPSLNHGIPDHPWSEVQEGAFAYKYAFMGIGLTFLEHALRSGYVTLAADFKNLTTTSAAQARAGAVNVSEAYGLWSDDKTAQGPMVEFLADVMLKNVAANDPNRREALVRFEDANPAASKTWSALLHARPDENTQNREAILYAKLRQHLTEVLNQGVTNSWHSKTSKIVGKAMNAAAVADTLHGMWGHFTL